ncbi:hypothetical protein TWF281_009528 [Arthrobotrys megalospora]
MKIPLIGRLGLSGSTGSANTASASFDSRSNITNSESNPWALIGDAKDCLLKELEELYWAGVEHEIESILFTLNEWQSSAYDNISLPDETDDFVHGFDTFMDQVNKDSRDFAERIEKTKNSREKTGNQDYKEAVEFALKNATTERNTSKLKGEIKQAIESETSIRKREDDIHRRTRMLLQATGLLDIEKLVEHRPPMDKMSFWKRPAIPQLALHAFSKAGIPILTSMRCSSCKSIIRSSMYRLDSSAADQNDTPAGFVCEDCHREKFLGQRECTKVYKHYILRDVITTEVGQKLCSCPNVTRTGSKGKLLPLFPMNIVNDHRTSEAEASARQVIRYKDSRGNKGSIRPSPNISPRFVECGLFKLANLVGEAKYYGIRTITSRAKLKKNKGMTIARAVLQASVMPEYIVRALERIDKLQEEARYVEKRERKKVNRPRNITYKGQPGPGMDPMLGSVLAVEEAAADDDIPFFLRRYTEQYPFGNVHMALRIGPLVVENGVANTQGGALITTRESLVFHSRRPIEGAKSLAVSEGQEGQPRQLWQQGRSQHTPKRFKAIMKQVIGSPFTGLLDGNLEDSIINALITSSQQAFNDPGLSRQDQARWLKSLVTPILKDLKILLANRVSIYISSIVSRLLDQGTNLKWSATTNNCQNFCDSLIDQKIFGSLISDPSPSTLPSGPLVDLYLMSFVCRPAGYAKPKISSKFDVPRGLTEEYLLRFRFGRHDEADMVDTLQEYWHDWGAFGKHLYKYQDLFPWDCTEAFGRYPQVCGGCNIAKHVWAFPFDSWSIIAFHLTRDRCHYPPGGEEKVMNEVEWMKNRLLVLCAQEKLIMGAAAMAKNTTFQKKTTWLHRQPDPSADRLKLGGIHRAQPFSHAYDQEKYHHYFLASWAHLKYEDQVSQYELLRDGRAKLPDVEYAKGLYNGESINSILERAGRGEGPDPPQGAPSISRTQGVNSSAGNPTSHAHSGYEPADSDFGSYWDAGYDFGADYYEDIGVFDPGVPPMDAMMYDLTNDIFIDDEGNREGNNEVEGGGGDRDRYASGTNSHGHRGESRYAYGEYAACLIALYNLLLNESSGVFGENGYGNDSGDGRTSNGYSGYGSHCLVTLGSQSSNTYSDVNGSTYGDGRTSNGYSGYGSHCLVTLGSQSSNTHSDVGYSGNSSTNSSGNSYDGNHSSNDYSSNYGDYSSDYGGYSSGYSIDYSRGYSSGGSYSSSSGYSRLLEQQRISRGLLEQQQRVPRGLLEQQQQIPRGLLEQQQQIPRGLLQQQQRVPRGLLEQQRVPGGYSSSSGYSGGHSSSYSSGDGGYGGYSGEDGGGYGGDGGGSGGDGGGG